MSAPSRKISNMYVVFSLNETTLSLISVASNVSTTPAVAVPAGVVESVPAAVVVDSAAVPVIAVDSAVVVDSAAVPVIAVDSAAV